MENGDLIETYWNVNKGADGFGTEAQYDLIETYWNVNAIGTVSVDVIFFDLIETYWNVNTHSFRFYT